MTEARHTPTDDALSADRTRWWVLGTVGVGTFMSALDASIVNVALPVIREELGTSVATVEWVVTVYLLVVSATLLGFGRIADVRGLRFTYLLGFGVFISGSVLAGVSPGVGWLVASRALQAIGAAMLYASAPAILTTTFPAEERGRALGLQATMTYLGLTVGPPLGGLLVDAVTWRAIFYINVPVGLAAVLLAWRFVPKRAGGRSGEPFDARGAVLFASGLVALMVALNQGHAWGWTSAPVLSLVALSLLLFSAFVRLQRRTTHPMLDLRLFSARTFSAATAAALLNYVAVYSLIFLMPFYLIQGRGLAPGTAGLVLMAQSAVMAMVAPLSGTLSDRIGPRVPATMGLAVFSAAIIGLSLLDSDAPIAAVVVALACAGLGTGLFTSPNNSALMGAAPRDRQGIAAGVLAEARNVGMVLGVGLAGAVFTSVLAGREPGPFPAFFDAVSAALLGAGAAAFFGATLASLERRPEG
ncbi:MAG: MFS transporter [Anaerosomatales bacterium]|nr:MFS transporter [Anaerosomatales bacterium]